MSDIVIQERLQAGFSVNREKRLVEGVCLLTPTSKNGYAYSDKAITEACQSYANAPVYIDHAENPSKRSVRSLAGHVKNPRMQEGKLYGDVKARRGAPGDDFLNIAEDQLEDPDWKGVGMSHVVQGSKSKNGKIVESITKVLSVDLVTGPATTVSLKESEDTPVELLEKLKPLLEGKKSAVDRLKAIYEACDIAFVEADQELPEQLVIESVDELREYAKDKPTLSKLIERHDELQRDKWMTEAIAEGKIPDTAANRKLLARCGDKDSMVEHAKVIKEAIDAAANDEDRPRQKGRSADGAKTLTLDELVAAFKK